MANWSPIPHTRKERVVNTGGAIEVTGGERQSLATYGTEASEALAVYVQCTTMNVPAELVGSADFRLMVTCDWGNGNASTVTDIDCTFRQRIPVVGSAVELSCWIAAFPYWNTRGRTPIGPFQQGGLGGENGVLQAPKAVTAQGRIFIGGGTDAVSLFPTFWLTQQNLTEGVYLAGQGRLVTFKYWGLQSGDGAVETYMQLFDMASAPVGGEIPFDSSPIDESLLEQRVLGQGQTRGVVQGLAWGLSTTPFVFTPQVVADTHAFTTAEFEE